MFQRDTIARWNETVSDAEPLLVPIIKKGRLAYKFPHLNKIRTYCKHQMEQLPKSYRKLTDPLPYPVNLSLKLEKALAAVTKKG
jgi:nicotinate phosphoribosyltransferase